MGKRFFTEKRLKNQTAILVILQFAAVIMSGLLIAGTDGQERILCLLLLLILTFSLVAACVLLFGPHIYKDDIPVSDDNEPETDKILPARHSVDRLSAKYEDSDKLAGLGCFLIKIGNLARINSDQGHDAGDAAISRFCEVLEDVGSQYGHTGRNGGNEYLVIIEDCDHTVTDLFLADLEKKVSSYNDENPDLQIEISYSYVLNAEACTSRFFGLIARTYQKFEGGAQQLI